MRRKRATKKKKGFAGGGKGSALLDHPALRKSTTKLKVPELIDPTQNINYVENAPGQVEGLVEIGTTKNLVEILKPMTETTLQVHARRLVPFYIFIVPLPPLLILHAIQEYG